MPVETDRKTKCMELVQEIAVKVVDCSEPALLSSEGTSVTVAYSADPLVVLMEVSGAGRVRLLSVSRAVSEDVVEVIDSAGTISVETPEKVFAVDRVHNPAIYDKVVEKFEEEATQLTGR